MHALLFELDHYFSAPVSVLRSSALMCGLQLQLSELLSEVSAARQPIKSAAVQAVVAGLKQALASLAQEQVSAAAAANAAAGSTAAAGALCGLLGSMGPDAQVRSFMVSVLPPSFMMSVLPHEPCLAQKGCQALES